MTMIDLKRTKAEMKADKSTDQPAIIGESDEPVYSYGTRLSFENNEIDKIDTLKKAQVGDLLSIKGIAKVIRVSAEEESANVEIQVQEIDISKKRSVPDTIESAVEEAKRKRIK